MTAQERDYEELLSRVLHSATDRIEPVGDGLAKIRVRLSEPWLKRQWWLLRSEFMVLGWAIAVRCQSFYAAVRSRSATPAGGAGGSVARADAGQATATGSAERGRWLRRLGPVVGGITACFSGITAWVASRGPGRGPADGPRKSPGPVMNWLRPTLAVAGAVVLVVAASLALGPLQRTLSAIGLSGAGGGGGGQPGSSQQGGGPGHTNGTGGRIGGPGPFPTPQGTESARRGTTPPSGAPETKSPCATPSATSPPPSATPTPSSTPTATPTPTVTPTATPTPTVTPTSSGSPPAALNLLTGRANGSVRTTALTCTSQTGPLSSPSDQASES